MRFIKLAIVLTILSLAPLTQATATSKLSIDGMYCGEAMSGGEMVEVRTKLDAMPDGTLTGAYLFKDQGENTPGQIEQYVAETGQTRTIAWRDKYGSGTATFQFDETGDSFSGFWGVNLNTPDFTWSGKRCDVPLV